MQQFSARALPCFRRAYPFLAIGCLVLVGCRKEEVSTFSVPKDSSTPVSATNAIASQPRVAVAPIRWKTPPGWEEQPASGMRVGSFSVSKDGQQAEVSIIPLGGMSGSELANVNRWRGQVGIEPLDQAGLAAAAEKVSIGGASASLYDIAGTDPQKNQPTRILAAILGTEGTTWFFKMTGPDALVASQKSAFKAFLESVRFERGTDALPAGHPPLPSEAMTSPATQESNGAAAEKPAWEIPSGWQEQPPTSMRVATFVVNGEQGEKADISVIKLAGDAGGALANVNRWRGQVGLQAVSEGELAKLVTTQDVSGVKVGFVDLSGRNVESGDPARLLAATVPRNGSTWFYKMLGNDQLVARQKAAFIKFVETARYPNAL